MRQRCWGCRSGHITAQSSSHLCRRQSQPTSHRLCRWRSVSLRGPASMRLCRCCRQLGRCSLCSSLQNRRLGWRHMSLRIVKRHALEGMMLLQPRARQQAGSACGSQPLTCAARHNPLPVAAAYGTWAAGRWGSPRASARAAGANCALGALLGPNGVTAARASRAQRCRGVTKRARYGCAAAVAWQLVQMCIQQCPTCQTGHCDEPFSVAPAQS